MPQTFLCQIVPNPLFSTQTLNFEFYVTADKKAEYIKPSVKRRIRYFAYKIPVETSLQNVIYLLQTVKIFIQHIKQQKMTVYFQTLKVEISSYKDIKRPELNKNRSFYIISSPEKFNSDQEIVFFWTLNLSLPYPKN